MAYPNYNDNWRNGVNTDYAEQFHNWSQNFLNNSWSNVSLAGNNSTSQASGSGDSQSSGSGDSQSWVSSLFGGGKGSYSLKNILRGVGTVTMIDQSASPIAGLLAGQNTTGVGNVMKAIPGMSTLGGLVNAAFGSHINQDFVDETNRQINSISGYASNATTNDSLLADFGNFMELSHVKKSEVGSDGWFSHKARDKTNALNASIDQANIKGYKSLLNTSNNVDSNNDLMAMQNYAAFGGPIDLGSNRYDWGGAIKIAQDYIKNHEGWNNKTYADSGGTATIGWGFTNSGFRSKYKDGITNHYKRGITQEQAQQELNWYLSNAAKTLDKIYGDYNLTDAQRAALLDTYYQRPASVSTNSRFYKALKAGDKDAVKYLGVAGYDTRNANRQALYSGNSPSTRKKEYEAPVDNTRVARPAVDFSVPRVAAFNNINVEPSELPAIGSLLKNNSSLNDILADVGVRPQQPTVSSPQVGTTEQIMQNYDNYLNNLGGINFLADGGSLGYTDLGKTLGNLQNFMAMKVNSQNTMNGDNSYATGGQLSSHGADFTNGLTLINEGGTHGENPNGGVPMGIDSNGIPNLVEEGETVWNGDYVFSDRLKVPKSLREKYHLPEGITYAEASKKLSKESLERTNDPISKRTLNVAFGELSDMQELKRAERQEREASKQAEQEALLNSDDVIASLGGSQPFAHGGRLGHIFDKGGVNYKDTYMRYAPIVGSFAMALSNSLNDPDYSNPNAIIRAAEVAGRPVSIPVDVIGDYRTRKPFDERYLTNLINQNNAAAIRSSLDIAGGNRAMGLSAILANNAVNEAKLAEAARQAYLANRADDMQVSEFNRGTNMFNAQANNQRNSAQAQLNSQRQATMLNGLARGYMMRQALDDQRSAAFSQNLTNAFQGLGDIGWENSQRNWLQSLADRGVLKGMFNSDGKQDFAGISNPSSGASSNSNGGKLKTKKRRF